MNLLSFHTVPYLVSAAVAAGITTLLWPRRRLPGVAAFMVLMAAASFWSLTNALEVAATHLEAKLFWGRIQYLAKAAIPVAWLVTALQYVGRGRLVTARMLVSLCVVPAVTLALVWTAGMHDWIVRDVRLDTTGPVALVAKHYGPWFWVHFVYSYGLIAIATIQILLSLLRAPRLFRGQATAWLLAAALPAVWNLTYVFGLDLFRGLDLSSAAFTLSGLALLWGFRRYQLFDLVPAARETVVDAMREGMLVLDGQGRIVDLNRAAAGILDVAPADALGVFAPDLVPPLTLLLDDDGAAVDSGFATVACPLDAELKYRGERRIYELRVSALNDGQPQPAGRLVMMMDVTDSRRLQLELRERSLVDELTGLYNRRGFLDLCQSQMLLARRRHQTAIVVFVDVDGLKAINDAGGHDAGDRLLRTAAAVLRSAFRESDVIARIGGDEFAVLAIDADRHGEARLAERINAARREFAAKGEPVAFSVGMATFDPAAPRPLEVLLKEADAVMYEQKHLRRTTAR